MSLVLRILVGVIGVLGLLIAAAIWAHPAEPLAKLGLETLGGLGNSTARADIGGFFGAAGGLALTAAVRAEARLLTAPLLLVVIALSGRVLTVVLDGYAPDVAQPMGVEAVLVAALAAGRRFIGPDSRA